MSVYIVDGVRTAIGNFQGSLAPFSAVDLGQKVVEALFQRQKLNPTCVQEIILGNVLQAGLGQNMARQVALKSKMAENSCALTLNMVCGSGLRSVIQGTQEILLNDYDLVVAGGAESMSNAPYLLPKARNGYKMGNQEVLDSMIHDGLWESFHQYHMGITAENIAQKYKISREEQDQFAYDSQRKALHAKNSQRFQEEIIPFEIPQRGKESLFFKNDEFIKEHVSLETLAKLRPAFSPQGSVTAGNASGINDGAAAVLLASEKALQEYSLKPMAKVVSYAFYGCDPQVMGMGPIEAVKKALLKASWHLHEVDLIEANEAFAVQSLAVGKILEWDWNKVNVNGGAVALGHPIGASGTRILVSLIHEMKKRHLQKGLCTLCIGGGMGIAMCVEITS